MYSKLLIITLILAPALGHAGQGKPRIDLSVASYAEQKAEVEAALADGATYAEIDSMKRREVAGALDRIAAVLEATGDVGGLTAEQKVKVFNDQELINTILTRAGEDSRIVCRREIKVGTRFAKETCSSVAERRRIRETAQSDLKRANLGNPLMPRD